jgi:hypothetical protein
MKPKSKPFGPFVDIPSSDIHPAGFRCYLCSRPVRVLRHVMPYGVIRMCFYSCRCGPSIIVWEDEKQPTAQIWPKNIELARKTKADMVIFNGERPLSEDFQGIN